MMPVIRVSDTTYRLLQKYAVPFEDTQDSVIMKMADFYEQHHSDNAGTLPSNPDNAQPKDPTPDLRFTKVLDAHFNGVKVKNWNGLLREGLIQAAISVGNNYEKLRRLTSANIDMDDRYDCGFEYIPKIDTSFQGVDSSSAWQLSKEIARNLGVPLSVDYVWRDRQGAAHPGEHGNLKFDPKKD